MPGSRDRRRAFAWRAAPEASARAREPAQRSGMPDALHLLTMLLLAVLAVGAVVGADALWVVAMGRHLVEHGMTPGVPFASAPTRGETNPLALAQLLLTGVDALSRRGFVVLLLAIDLVVLSLLAHRLRHSSLARGEQLLLLFAAAAGSFTWMAIARLPMLSLVPFVAVVLLVERDDRVGDSRVWLVPVVIAVWANLHGGVLLGVCVVLGYLALGRLRRQPWSTLALGVTSVAALVATPLGLGTISYYRGVFENEAAKRHTDLWARPDVTQPLDLVMMVALLVVLIVVVRHRPRPWVLGVLAGLTIATFMAARNGVWLALAGPLLAGAPLPSATQRRPGRRGVVAAVSTVVVVTGILAGRGPRIEPQGEQLVATVRTLAHGQPVAAEAALAETFAARGLTVWAANPVDAFQPAVQVALLDFLHGRSSGVAVVDGSAVVVTSQGSPAHQLMVTQKGWESKNLAGATVWTRTWPNGDLSSLRPR